MSDQQNVRRVGPSARVRVGVGAAIVLVVAALVCSVLVTALSPVGATTVLAPRSSGGSGASATPSGSATGAGSPTAPDAPGAAGATGGGGAGGAQGAADAPGGLTAPGEAGDSGGGGGAGALIFVHVLGAVAVPGVYELREGSRVFDGVALAGGFSEGADQTSVNLARPLADGEQVRVLAVGEAPPVSGPGVASGGGAGSTAGGAGPAPGAPGGAPVNLNSATVIDLDALPRIGPAMAGRIVAWREENGPFAAVDDLLQVTGIGEKTLDGLRDLVSV
jgi:competence protein ComEA